MADPYRAVVADPRVERAVRRYELATFGGDPTQLDLADRDLDAAEADVAVARGRIRHARYLVDRVEDPRELADFERAASLYAAAGDVPGRALASFWIGCFHQVVRHDGSAALPALTRALDEGGPLTRSYAARHLGFHAFESGDPERAGALLEESLRLRRSDGSPAEVAAALLAVAEHRIRTGRTDEARELLDDAERAAQAAGARGVLGWITATRAELSARSSTEGDAPADQPGG
jgi:tetratricopeptide (TPR) repeat protein